MGPVRNPQSMERMARFPLSSSSSSSSASLRIVPRGFESTSHPIFQQYRPPVYRPRASSSGNQVNQDKPSICTLIISSHNVSTSSTGDSSHKNPSTIHGMRASCSICLRPIVRPVTVVSPSNCVHSYCFGCLFRWFQQRTVCPLCNTHAAAFITFIAHTKEDEDQGPSKIPRIIPTLNSIDTEESLDLGRMKQIDAQNVNGYENDKQDDEIQLWKFISSNKANCSRPSSSSSDASSVINTDESEYPSNDNSSSSTSSSRKRKFESVARKDQNIDCDEDEQDPSLSYALRIHKQRFSCS